MDIDVEISVKVNGEVSESKDIERCVNKFKKQMVDHIHKILLKKPSQFVVED